MSPVIYQTNCYLVLIHIYQVGEMTKISSSEMRVGEMRVGEMSPNQLHGMVYT